MAGALKNRHLAVVRGQAGEEEYQLELKRSPQPKGVGKLLNSPPKPASKPLPPRNPNIPPTQNLGQISSDEFKFDEMTRNREIPKELLETLRQNVKVEDKYSPQIQQSRSVRRTNAIYSSSHTRAEQRQKELRERVPTQSEHPAIPNLNSVTKSGSNFSVIALCLIGLLGLGLWGYRSGFIEFRSYQSVAEVDDYRTYWLSGQPSLMRQVLSAATEDPPVFEAEAAIITAAVKGEKVAKIRNDLIRIAFDPRWEESLSAADRILAITLGAVELVPDKLADLPALADAHPGVALAVAAQLDIDRPFGQFAAVSTGHLAELPEPIGIAFRELQSSGVRTLSERQAMALSHIVSGSADERTLVAYFDQNLEHRLVSILGVIKLSSEPALAEQILKFLLGTESTLGIQLSWFEQEPSAEWDKVDSYAKLMVALGGEPTGLSLAQNSDLLAFPSEGIRKFASQEIKKQMPGQVDSMVNVLAGAGNKLTRLQTIFLISALSVKDKSRDPLIAKWFSFSPDPQTVLDLLLARGELTQPDNFSFEAARYLINSENLQTSFEQLKALTTNPEPLARALAYSRFNLADRPQAKLLEAMSVVEPNGDLRQKIMDKIQLELGVTGMND